MDVAGIVDRSLSQAQHISQFLEVMIQLLNRGSAAVRHFYSSKKTCCNFVQVKAVVKHVFSTLVPDLNADSISM
jgi:hypothetical protein